MLRPFLPFKSDETPISYAIRMSRFHTGHPLSATLKDLRIDPQALASNKPAALARLAEISGVDEMELRRNSPVMLGRCEYDIRGEIVSAEFLSSPKVVFCPACLQEDDEQGARRMRWHWSLAVVRTCPVHEVALQHKAKSGWNDVLQSLDQVVRGEALRSIAAASPRRPTSPLQDYVIARLDGQGGSPWLDDQTLDLAVRATELLGVLLAFGAEQPLADLSEDDWDHAGRIGFGYTSQGEDGICQALQEQFNKFSNATRSPRPRKLFGGLYNALARSKSMKDAGDIARILREFIWSNIAMPAGTKILGQLLPERRLHTVASLAKETGHDARRLQNLLVGEGIIAHDAASHFAIPVDLGREIAARMKSNVMMTDLPKVMNCPRPLVLQLCAERALTPIYCGNPGARGKLQKGVDGDEVAALMNALSENSRCADAAEGLVTIAEAAEKAEISAACVVQLICAGLLQHAVRLDGLSGFDAVRVCPTEVKSVSSTHLVGMTASDAFAKLKIKMDTGWELVDLHPNEVSLAPHRFCGVNPEFVITRFLPESIASFDMNFTSVSRAAVRHKCLATDLKSLLYDARVKPVLDWRQVGMNIYHVSDIAKVLPS